MCVWVYIQPQENWKSFFWHLGMFDVCTTGVTAHIDTIFKFMPHARQHGCIDILHCCNEPCLYVSEVMWRWWDEYPVFDISPKKKNHRAYLCTKCTLHSNHRLTRVIFQNTKRLLPQSGHFFYYIHSHRLAAEMWTTMKNNLLGKEFWFFSFYL
jgi:hypothetical protein